VNDDGGYSAPSPKRAAQINRLTNPRTEMEGESERDTEEKVVKFMKSFVDKFCPSSFCSWSAFPFPALAFRLCDVGGGEKLSARESEGRAKSTDETIYRD